MDKKDLYTALAKAQSEFPVIAPNRKNNRGYYADLPHIRRHIDPILNKHGLSLQQHVDEGKSAPAVIRCILGHSSGQSDESCAPLVLDDNNKTMSKNQVVGSAISYMKRYTYISILGICISEDPDDDDGYIEPVEFITRDQEVMLVDMLKHHPQIKDRVLKGFGITTVGHVPKREFVATCRRIKELIELESSPQP